MVPILSIVFMSVSAIIAIGLPILLFVLFRKKYQLKAVPLLTGAAVFIVFALILERIFHTFVLSLGVNGVAALLSKQWLYVLYGILAAGIFEETGRFVAFKLLKKKFNGIGTAISYGIGHGGIEAILLAGVTMVSNVVFSILSNTGVTSILGNNPAITSTLSALTGANSLLFLAGGVERMSAVVVQISLSLIVWLAVNSEKKVWLYPVAILLHALVNLPAAMMQAGLLKSFLLVEIIVAAEAIVLAIVTIWVCRKRLKSGELS